MDLMKMASGALTPFIANKLAGAFGVPPGLAKKAVSVALPVLMAAFLKRGATSEGAQAIGSALGRVSDNPLSSLGEMLGGSDDDARSVGQSGKEMLASILGQTQSESLTDKLAAYAGGEKNAMAGLLGVVGTGALASMRKTADDRGLDTAGLLNMMSAQKDEIAAAIPADLASNLRGTGLLPDDVQTAALGSNGKSATSSGGGWLKWAAAAAVLALAVWLVPQFFRTAPDASTGTEIVADADPLIVDGTNIGESVEGVLASLTETLSGVSDVASAQSAVESLTSADETLGTLETSIGNLTEEGRSALSELVGGAMPALQETVESLLGDTEIAALLKPVLDSIMSRLGAMAA